MWNFYAIRIPLFFYCRHCEETDLISKHCFLVLSLNKAETASTQPALLSGMFLCISLGAYYTVKITTNHMQLLS